MLEGSTPQRVSTVHGPDLGGFVGGRAERIAASPRAYGMRLGCRVWVGIRPVRPAGDPTDGQIVNGALWWYDWRMSRALRSLVERQIQKARLSGGLSGLAGEGKPLPDRTGQELVDPALGAAMRIMAEAGVVPEEFGLKKALAEARAHYATLTEPAAKKAAMAKIADLEMRLNIAQDARRKFLG